MKIVCPRRRDVTWARDETERASETKIEPHKYSIAYKHKQISTSILLFLLLRIIIFVK
jgi:hypothetical protein